MILHVIEAKYQKDYQIWLKFNDGAEGVIDLKEQLFGEMFEPLKEINNFKSFCVDPELETLVWENGADFAPEFLQSHLVVKA